MEAPRPPVGGTHVVAPPPSARSHTRHSAARPTATALIRALCVVGVLLVATSAAPPAAAQSVFVAPVDGVVTDTFRPPEHFAGPGNRGWEYRTTSGSTVRAAASGVVAFAGAIAGRLYVSIDHPDGLRTTYSGLASVAVERGQPLAAGGRIGTTGTTFHFGVRRGTEYLDPALFLGSPPVPGPPPRPRLMPRPGGVI